MYEEISHTGNWRLTKYRVVGTKLFGYVITYCPKDPKLTYPKQPTELNLLEIQVPDELPATKVTTLCQLLELLEDIEPERLFVRSRGTDNLEVFWY